MTDYYPFGEVRLDQTTTAHRNSYKFTGKELDSDTGLYYYGARYYNPAIGRFVSQDPWEGDLKDPQTLNKYSYVRNNPLRYVDPTGKYIVDNSSFKIKLNFNKTCDGDCVLGSDTSFNNSVDYSSSKSGIIDESGNPKQYDFSGFTDTDDMISSGITVLLGSKVEVLKNIAKFVKNTIKNEAGAATRPKGIPEDWIEKSTKRNDGTIYQDPKNPHNSVRVMDGNPNSPNPAQQKPYSKQMKSGKALDVKGNPVNPNSAGSHIPSKYFKFKP